MKINKLIDFEAMGNLFIGIGMGGIMVTGFSLFKYTNTPMYFYALLCLGAIISIYVGRTKRKVGFLNSQINVKEE